jgi:crotonobetainyl-CoA:carnitine CoA-transferase CaiB-like acyl-CoA transferase
MGPLHGLQVLDLSAMLPGPFCAQSLGDLGADVIKVEPPAGEMTRRSTTGILDMTNRNKRAIVLDLKTANGVRDCLALAARSDVVIEGFRPGVVDRLGVGFAAVSAVRPGIVYCSISGYGQQGPEAQTPGHDVNYLAASGALSYSGQWRRLGPLRPAIPVADLGAALYASVSILAALRQRDATGQSIHIDIALADCAMALATARGGQKQAILDEDRLHLFPTNGIYRCADGQYIALGVVEEHFWQGLCDELAVQESRIRDPRFATEALRRKHGDEVLELIEKTLALASADDWVTRLAARDVPVSKIVTLAQAVESPQAQARGLVATLDGERHVMFPALWNGRPVSSLRLPTPLLGQHTVEVLATLRPTGTQEPCP